MESREKVRPARRGKTVKSRQRGAKIRTTAKAYSGAHVEWNETRDTAGMSQRGSGGGLYNSTFLKRNKEMESLRVMN